MSDKKLGVAVVYEACKCCGNKGDESIVMNKRLTKGNAKKVDDIHGRVVGFMEGPCSTCKEQVDNGYFILCGADPEKSNIVDGKITPENVYRTGDVVYIKKEIAEEMIDMDFSSNWFAFVDPEVINLLQNLLEPTEE